MKVGDTAYIVESNRYVREVEIRRRSGGMFMVRFTDTGGGIQVKAHRLLGNQVSYCGVKLCFFLFDIKAKISCGFVN